MANPVDFLLQAVPTMDDAFFAPRSSTATRELAYCKGYTLIFTNTGYSAATRPVHIGFTFYLLGQSGRVWGPQYTLYVYSPSDDWEANRRAVLMALQRLQECPNTIMAHGDTTKC